MHRYAIYYAPRPDEGLARFAGTWLGRDPESGAILAQPTLSDISQARQADITADPRRYGFHGTLKAPFRLAPGLSENDLLNAVSEFAVNQHGFLLDGLSLAEMDGFLALTPRIPSQSLVDLAADCVRTFDRFRAPPTPEELSRRRSIRLSPRQDELLTLWGYPLVLDEFRFHLTLTGRLDGVECELVRRALDKLTEPFRDAPLPIRDLTIFGEEYLAAPFRVLARFPLGEG